MNKIIIPALLLALAAVPAQAALSVGAKAPDFSAAASLGGKEFNFSLSELLKNGPAGALFIPAAFTKGCTIKAHDFAEATDQFKALGATVIGVSHDDVATLDSFLSANAAASSRLPPIPIRRSLRHMMWSSR